MQRKALHGEQYIEFVSPIPRKACLVTRPFLVDIQDKGKAAVVVIGCETIDTETGRKIAVNEITSFVIGAGGCGSIKSPLARSPAATNRYVACFLLSYEHNGDF